MEPVEAERRETVMVSPHQVYRERLDARRRTLQALVRRYRLIANGRIASFVLAVVVAWLAFAWHWLPGWLLAVPVTAFILLVIWHGRVSRARQVAQRAVDFYEKGLARLEYRWTGTGRLGTRFLDEAHPNAVDLDLFGTGSLFERLCPAVTRLGEDTLAAWIRAPAATDEIRGRQAAVTELRPRLDLREELDLLCGELPTGVDLEALVRWGAAPPVFFPQWARIAAVILAAAAVATLAGWMLLGTGMTPFLVVLVIEGIFAWWLNARVARVVEPVERRSHDLAQFSGILGRLEREGFATPYLRTLREALDTGGLPPSRRLAQLARLVDWLDAKHNQLFAFFAPMLLWTTQLAFAIEAWRATVGPAIGRWLNTMGQFEALAALAGYAFENPEDVFPEIVSEGACFEGEGIGHPLMPADQFVRNDVRLCGEPRLLMVSGSNMSGKSTLLRTVGVNTVLGLAGAPVRGRKLRLSPLVVGTTLRIHDSLQAGRSRFYAEIMRVRQLVDLAKGATPLLFLLDELFQGTNSHDRRLGAEAVVQQLIDSGAIGLVTTHDLALTDIADRLRPRARNVHFEDHFENGTMTFDYRMRPGRVEKSNAIALMRAVGIEV